jgi:hypothetical protein
MRIRSMRTLLLFVLLVVTGIVSGCGNSAGDPKQTVIKMFGAMQRDDRAALTSLLDLPALMETMNGDYALQTDSPRVFHSPEQILDDLTGDGATKQRWFSLQRIIGESQVNGNSATVQVTFVDKANSKGYLTKFGLHIINGKWRIYSFKTEEAPPASSVG